MVSRRRSVAVSGGVSLGSVMVSLAGKRHGAPASTSSVVVAPAPGILHLALALVLNIAYGGLDILVGGFQVVLGAEGSFGAGRELGAGLLAQVADIFHADPARHGAGGVAHGLQLAAPGPAALGYLGDLPVYPLPVGVVLVVQREFLFGNQGGEHLAMQDDAGVAHLHRALELAGAHLVQGLLGLEIRLQGANPAQVQHAGIDLLDRPAANRLLLGE